MELHELSDLYLLSSILNAPLMYCFTVLLILHPSHKENYDNSSMGYVMQKLKKNERTWYEASRIMQSIWIELLVLCTILDIDAD